MFDDLAGDLVSCAVDILGISAEYMPLSGGSYLIDGIFDKLFEQVDPDTEIVVASQAPMFDVKTKDLKAEPVKGDKIKIKGIVYKVTDSQEDGVAAIKLVLQRDKRKK